MNSYITVKLAENGWGDTGAERDTGAFSALLLVIAFALL